MYMMIYMMSYMCRNGAVPEGVLDIKSCARLRIEMLYRGAISKG